MKDITPVTTECKICGRRTEGDLLLCNLCRSNEGRTLLNVGDLPHIFIIISSILIFFVSYSNSGDVFWIKGFEVDISRFILILEVMIFFIVAFTLFIYRDVFKKIEGMRTLIISILPVLVAFPLSLILTRGIGVLTITVVVVSIPLLISSIVLTSKLIERWDIYWMVITNFVLLIFGFSILESINGNPYFFSIEFISNPLIAGIMVPVIFIQYIRFFRKLPINAKQLAFVITMVSTILMVLLSYNIHEMSATTGSAIIWSFSLILFTIHISAMFVRRSVEDMLNRTLVSSKHHMKEFNNFGRSGKHLYQLHHLDMMINDNPVHGLGDKKDRGNVIFSIGGIREDKDLEGEVDEFVNAHSEKAMLLASKGKFPEAITEYKAAISKNPEIYRTYYQIAVVQATLPGKEKEVEKNLKLFFKSRRMYIDKMIETGLPARYIYVFNDLYDGYIKAIYLKIELLNKIGRSGDIWSYFTLLRD